MDTDKIRNVAFISHAGAGKSALIEDILFDYHIRNIVGHAHDHTSVITFDPIEINHKFSTAPAIATLSVNDYQINIVNTPGHSSFTHEAQACLSSVGCALLVASAITGLKAETENMWQAAKRNDLPTLIFINKLDKDHADFYNALSAIRKKCTNNAHPLYLPLFKDEKLIGLIDIIKMKSLIYSSKPEDNSFNYEEIDANNLENAQNYRSTLLKVLYPEGYNNEPEEDIKKRIQEAVLNNGFLPVLCGSARANVGVNLLIDNIISYLPSPSSRKPVIMTDSISGMSVQIKDSDKNLSAYIFKTLIDNNTITSYVRIFSGSIKIGDRIYNSTSRKYETIKKLYILLGKNKIEVASLHSGQIGAIEGLKNTNTLDTLSSDQDVVELENNMLLPPLTAFSIKYSGSEDIMPKLLLFMKEDTVLKIKQEDANNFMFYGIDQLHISILLEKIQQKLGIELELVAPYIPFRQTVTSTQKAISKFMKNKEYAEVAIEVSPLAKGEGYIFEDTLVSGIIPHSFIPIINKAIYTAATIDFTKLGLNYPLTDFKAKLINGVYKPSSSTDRAFESATTDALIEIIEKEQLSILEPIMTVDIYCAEKYVGTLINNISSKRGKIENVEPQAFGEHINASIPMMEVLKYSKELAELTDDNTFFAMKFKCYEDLPDHLIDKIKN